MPVASTPPAIGGPEAIAADEIRSELERILAGSEFRASRRRRDMLSYLVGELLEGRADRLKGYTIGVSVFGRGTDFDATTDPVVRLEARRLRRDLASYYVAEGNSNPLRISIPKGNYAPEIRRAEPGHVVAPAPGVGADAMSEEAPVEEFANTQAMADPPPPGGKQGVAELTGSPHHKLRLVALTIGAALALVIIGWLALDRGPRSISSSLAEGPSVMVLPFEAQGSRPSDDAMAAGIADQIIGALSRFEDFRLYLPDGNPRLVSPDEPLKAARDRGISYLVTGSVASDASMARITARLVDVGSGRVMWTGDYDRAYSPQVFLAAQADISAAVASALGQPYGVIKTAMARELSGEAAPSMSSYECVLRAYVYRRTFPTAQHGPILACLQAAIARDPGYVDAWAMLGWLRLDAARFRLVPPDQVGASFEEAVDAASRAVALDASSVLGLKALASIEHYLGKYDESERLQRRALELNPNDPDTLAQLGWRLAVRGRFDEGIPYLKRAIARSVNPPGWYFHLIAIDDYLGGRYDDMLSVAKRSAVDGSGISWSLVAIASGALGHDAEAREALDRMAKGSPRLASDPAAVYRGHQATEQIVEALVGGLNKAGGRRAPMR